MAYTPRDRYNDEIMGLREAINRGENPWGGVENAFAGIYNEFGIPAGVSSQEAKAAVYESFSLPNPDDQAAQNQGSGKEFTAQELADATAAHNSSVKLIENAYAAGLLSFKQKQKMIDENRDELMTQKVRGLENLGLSRDAGIEANTGFFNQISPDAFQSQQGVYNKKVTDEFGRGKTDILNQFNKGVSSLDDNQAIIDQAKGHFEDANRFALEDELRQYNAGAGAFTGGDFTSSLNANSAPNLSTFNPIAFNANPSGASARPAPQSPNAVVGRRNPVGAQGSSAKQDDIDRFLNG